MPLIRDDLHLDYVAIGFLLSVPILVADLIEIPVGLLADNPRRTRLVIGGGALFAAALAAFALAPTYAVLVLAMIVLYPASGAFVSLSQADLMDARPDRREQNMARWTLAGSLGALAGPAVLAIAVLAGAGWRGAYLGLTIAAVAVMAWRLLAGGSPHLTQPGAGASIRESMLAAVRSLRRGQVLRALLLLEIGDLMLDLLTGYIALYFVDTLGEPAWVGALAVGIRIGSGLAGDFLSVHLLERVSGTGYVRVTAALTVLAYPVFLLVPGVVPKLAMLAVVSVLTAGWYPVLQAKVYEALPGQSGAQLAIANVVNIAASPLPLVIGLGAARFGLGTALWLIAASPLIVALLIPREPPPVD